MLRPLVNDLIRAYKMDDGIVRPSTLAVFRLTTKSNLVGCSMGRSPGLAPLRILWTRSAARRIISNRFGPLLTTGPCRSDRQGGISTTAAAAKRLQPFGVATRQGSFG